MATDKPRITAYVRQDIFDRFDEYCKKWEVKHSKGIELLLTEYFTGNTPDITLDPERVSAGISEDKVNALIDERLAAMTHSSSTPIDTVTRDELNEQVKKYKSVLDRVTHLEDTLENVELESNGAFLKELDRRDERINKVNNELLERVSHLNRTSNSLGELVTKNDLTEVKDAIENLTQTVQANQNAIAQIQQNKQLELNFESTQLDKTPALSAPSLQTSENSRTALTAPGENAIRESSANKVQSDRLNTDRHSPENNTTTPPSDNNNDNKQQPEAVLDGLLTKKEAYKLACDRGYKSSINAFAQVFVDAKKAGGFDRVLFGIRKAKERGKYIDVGIDN